MLSSKFKGRKYPKYEREKSVLLFSFWKNRFVFILLKDKKDGWKISELYHRFQVSALRSKLVYLKLVDFHTKEGHIGQIFCCRPF